MNKTDLYKAVATQTGTKLDDVTKIVDTFFKEMSQSLREEDVAIKDFGTFKKATQSARIARNPRTGEEIQVPEKEVIKFKASKNILKMKWL